MIPVPQMPWRDDCLSLKYATSFPDGRTRAVVSLACASNDHDDDAGWRGRMRHNDQRSFWKVPEPNELPLFGVAMPRMMTPLETLVMSLVVIAVPELVVVMKMKNATLSCFAFCREHASKQ